MPAKRNRKTKKPHEDRPLEIPMTDLDQDFDGEEQSDGSKAGDRYAAGTPGGGTASGGLAGTNVGDGSPENVNLENAMGSGIHDTAEESDEGDLPYAGRTGGAIGGTPARGRAKRGRGRHRFAPDQTHRGDSTLGSK